MAKSGELPVNAWQVAQARPTPRRDSLFQFPLNATLTAEGCAVSSAGNR